ncbi:MAG: D-beta-D-heptose 7-phosphate kinase / D-beta-D-heptose 1-phosphate adenosyltransferase [Pseudonocardiales bacterium]|nr:D-beta-D-heptose 7-phosphate kinase / D-beta-D-heptose 1-phosphate adenosyltransferase [Pseudonocardiales bacterium]
MTGSATGPVVVIGDVMLDVDVEGRADRLCPDAPVPVLDVVAERARPGGAALAAVVLARAGVPVTLVTALDADPDGVRLREHLDGHVRLVTGPGEGGTAVKTRLRADGRSLLRTDRGAGRPGEGFGAAVRRSLKEVLAGAGAVLVSDYGRGVTADTRVRAAVAHAAASGVPVVWDPHPLGSAPVPGTTVATPNAAEARAAAGGSRMPAAQLGSVLAALADATELLSRWGCRSVAVTLGPRGAVVAHRHGARAASPAPVVVGGDPCGAGDVFAGRVAALLADGATVDDAVHGAVQTAATFVAAGGAAGLATRPSTDPGPAVPAAVGMAAARALAARVAARGGTVVASGGCFDLLHTGHSRTLAAARALGDCLVVLLNSDESVRRLKGETRPIVPAAERAELLLALECVDAVVVFCEDDPCATLAQLRPDLWVKGGDHDPAELPETALVRSWGGEVTAVPYRPGRSTTRLVEVASGRDRAAEAAVARSR